MNLKFFGAIAATLRHLRGVEETRSITDNWTRFVTYMESIGPRIRQGHITIAFERFSYTIEGEAVVVHEQQTPMGSMRHMAFQIERFSLKKEGADIPLLPEEAKLFLSFLESLVREMVIDDDDAHTVTEHRGRRLFSPAERRILNDPKFNCRIPSWPIAS